MPSRTSFFNATLFRKNIHRAWPLWGMLSLLGSLLPLYLLLNLLEHPGDMTQRSFAECLCIVSTRVPLFAFLYAVPVAMLVWGYLYNSRSVGFLHTLPMHRAGLFVTNLLSGFVILLIPYVITGGLLCVEALYFGFFDATAVFIAIAAVILSHITFFGIATLCAMVTGNLFAMPALYVLANFIAPLVEYMVSTLAEDFLLGISAEVVYADRLSPLWRLLENLSVDYIWVNDELVTCSFEGMSLLLIYGAAGLLLLGVSWLFYRLRRSESAGDVSAFRWLTPFFRYGAAFLSAITLGRIFYSVVWESTLQSGSLADRLPMIICLAAAGVIGYYLASMLLEKTLRVFRHTLHGVTAVTLGAALLCLGCAANPFGIEDYVPDIAEIESVYAYVTNLGSFTTDPAENSQLTEEVLALHQAIVDDKDYLRQTTPKDGLTPYDDDNSSCVRIGVEIEYELTDGRTVRRDYPLYLTEERIHQEGTSDAVCMAMLNSPTLHIYNLKFPAERDWLNTYIEFWYQGSGASETAVNNVASVEDDDVAEGLYAAVLSDLQNGRGTVRTFETLLDGSTPADPEKRLTIHFEAYLGLSNDAENSWDSRSIEVLPTMTDTLTYLAEHEILSEKNIALFAGE